MRRLILFVLWAALLIGIAVVVADHEGAVSVEWLGYRIDTSTSVVLIGLAIVAVASALVYRVWRTVATAPRRWRRARALRRRERGYRALTLGLVAAAASDRAEAQRQSRRASALLEGQPLALMLGAQAAQLGGDAAAARRLYDQMLTHPDTAFLGLRGLIAAALDAGDQRAALDYAARARALSPDAPWLLDRLFELHAEMGDWTAAAAVADRAAKLRALDGPEASATGRWRRSARPTPPKQRDGSTRRSGMPAPRSGRRRARCRRWRAWRGSCWLQGAIAIPSS